MNFPNEGVPVVLGTRPARGRVRLSSDHRQPIYIESNGYLYPASSLGQPPQRSASSSGHGRRSPTILIDNSKSTACSRGRSAHYEDDSDEWSPVREHRRHTSRGRHYHKPERSRTPSPSPEIQAQLKILHGFQEKEREAEQRQRYEEEQTLKKAAEEKKKRDEEKMKEAAIKEHNNKLLEKANKEKKAKEEADKEFRERVKTTFGKAGYSEEDIERILENKEKGKGHEGQKKIMDLTRPTYIKVHLKHLSPDTLDAYDLPWEVDEKDGNYLIIKRWIPEHDQEILFEHTRKLREKPRPLRLTDTSVEKRGRDNLLLVRKRSPGRRRSATRAWMLT